MRAFSIIFLIPYFNISSIVIMFFLFFLKNDFFNTRTSVKFPSKSQISLYTNVKYSCEDNL